MSSFPVGDAYQVEEVEGEKTVHCAKCHFRFGPATFDPKLGCLMNERTVEDISTLNTSQLSEEVVVREFCCPECGHLKAVDVQKKGAPILVETLL